MVEALYDLFFDDDHIETHKQSGLGGVIRDFVVKNDRNRGCLPLALRMLMMDGDYTIADMCASERRKGTQTALRFNQTERVVHEGFNAISLEPMEIAAFLFIGVSLKKVDLTTKDIKNRLVSLQQLRCINGSFKTGTFSDNMVTRVFYTIIMFALEVAEIYEKEKSDEGGIRKSRRLTDYFYVDIYKGTVITVNHIGKLAIKKSKKYKWDDIYSVKRCGTRIKVNVYILKNYLKELKEMARAMLRLYVSNTRAEEKLMWLLDRWECLRANPFVTSTLRKFDGSSMNAYVLPWKYRKMKMVPSEDSQSRVLRLIYANTKEGVRKCSYIKFGTEVLNGRRYIPLKNKPVFLDFIDTLS